MGWREEGRLPSDEVRTPGPHDDLYRYRVVYIDMYGIILCMYTYSVFVQQAAHI